MQIVFPYSEWIQWRLYIDFFLIRCCVDKSFFIIGRDNLNFSRKISFSLISLTTAMLLSLRETIVSTGQTPVTSKNLSRISG